MESLKDLKQGTAYVLTYTQPLYIRAEHRYLPDNFRYTEPEVRNVRYGGLVNEPSICTICGKRACVVGKFLDTDTFEEFTISRGCLKHPSTRLWVAGTKREVIDKWYQKRELEDGAERGDKLAKLALAFRDMEDE